LSIEKRLTIEVIEYQQRIDRTMKNKITHLFLLFALAAPVTAFAVGSNESKNVTTFYTKAKDIVPNNFSVEAGQKVRLEVNPSDTGSGCMSAIMVPGLWDKPEPLVKGKKIIMEFTPKKPGAYKITCAMGVQRGVINVR
jgi:plastocyanin domain-containing protein